MSTAEIIVIVAGLAAIAWVNWYFFVAGRTVGVATAAVGGVQRMQIEVHSGYSPAVVRVRAGQPVRLDFHRTENSSCTEEVVIPDFGIRTFLKPFATTPVEFTPTPGDHEFTCGMGMVRGRIIADAN